MILPDCEIGIDDHISFKASLLVLKRLEFVRKFIMYVQQCGHIRHELVDLKNANSLFYETYMVYHVTVMVEGKQYLTGVGLFKFDDMISNNLGGTIGYWFAAGAKREGER